MKIRTASSLTVFETPNASITPLATRKSGAEQVSIIRQRMQGSQRNPMHAHTSEEVMLMLDGAVDVTVDGITRRLAAGDTLIVPAGSMHCIENGGGQPAEWLIVSPLGMQFLGADGGAMTPAWAE